MDHERQKRIAKSFSKAVKVNGKALARLEDNDKDSDDNRNKKPSVAKMDDAN